MESSKPPGKQAGPGRSETSHEVIVAMMNRAAWEHSQFGKAWRVIFALLALLGISLVFNAVQFLTREKPQNYAITPDLRVMPLTPVSEEMLSPESVRQWATRVVPSAYALDYRNHKQQLASLEPHFTPEGYKGFLESIARSKLVDTIKEKNYVVSAVVREVPTIIGTTKLKGAFAWKISAPILVTYQSGANAVTQNLVVTLVAVRVPQTRNNAGIAIQNFIAARGT